MVIRLSYFHSSIYSVKANVIMIGRVSKYSAEYSVNGMTKTGHYKSFKNLNDI